MSVHACTQCRCRCRCPPPPDSTPATLTPCRRAPLTAQVGCEAVFFTYWYTRRPPADGGWGAVWASWQAGAQSQARARCSSTPATSAAAAATPGAGVVHPSPPSCCTRAALLLPQRQARDGPGVFTIRVLLDRLWYGWRLRYVSRWTMAAPCCSTQELCEKIEGSCPVHGHSTVRAQAPHCNPRAQTTFSGPRVPMAPEVCVRSEHILR